MLKIWFGVLLVAIITADPALAQNYNKNWYECVHEVGAAEVVRPSGDHLRQFRFYSEAQHMAFIDCVARKAKLAPTPTIKGSQRPSH